MGTPKKWWSRWNIQFCNPEQRQPFLTWERAPSRRKFTKLSPTTVVCLSIARVQPSFGWLVFTDSFGVKRGTRARNVDPRDNWRTNGNGQTITARECVFPMALRESRRLLPTSAQGFSAGKNQTRSMGTLKWEKRRRGFPSSTFVCSSPREYPNHSLRDGRPRRDDEGYW